MDKDQPRVRPVSPVRTDQFVVYVANLRQYRKTKEIHENPKVELCYVSKEHDQVRITGTASILEDSNVIDEIWEANPLLRQYLVSKENPDLIIYRIEPNRVQFMREWAMRYQEVPLAREKKSAAWIPYWYDLDPPIEVNQTDSFEFFDCIPENLTTDYEHVFAHGIEGSQPAFESHIKILKITHPILGEIQRISTGLQYEFHLADGTTVHVDAEEEIGSSHDCPKKVTDWSCQVEFVPFDDDFSDS